MLNTAELYNVRGRTWNRLPDLNHGRFSHSSVYFFKNISHEKSLRKIYVFSGINAENQRVQEIESYPNGALGNWKVVKMQEISPSWRQLRNLHLIQINSEQILAFGCDEQQGW